MAKMIITVDGPAAAGKGTLCKKLAEKYGLAYFDTGMVYRAVGLKMYISGLDVNDKTAAFSVAKGLTFAQMMELSVHPDFRSSIGGYNASIVSAYPSVRSELLKMQQDFSKNPVFPDGTPAKGAIYDGRDTGTVVCPNADVKIFITASPEVRAERRFKEFQAKGNEITYEEVLADVKIRDDRDTNRSTAPLKPAEDAIILDTTKDTIEDVFQKSCNYIDACQSSKCPNKKVLIAFFVLLSCAIAFGGNKYFASEKATEISESINFSDAFKKAVRTNNIAEVKSLVKKGLDLNVSLPADNSAIPEDENIKKNQTLTPLAYAIMMKRQEISMLLIKNGADINVSTPEGSLLFWAIYHNMEDVAAYLIKKKSNILPSKGYNPALQAAKMRRFNILEMLKTAGVDIHTPSQDNTTSPSLPQN